MPICASLGMFSLDKKCSSSVFPPKKFKSNDIILPAESPACHSSEKVTLGKQHDKEKEKKKSGLIDQNIHIILSPLILQCHFLSEMCQHPPVLLNNHNLHSFPTSQHFPELWQNLSGGEQTGRSL